MGTTSLSLFDLVPGKVLFDRYTLLRPHRDGGMSAAFAVEDQENDERRELQVFPSSMFEDRDQAREFADKMSAWTEVEAESVLKVHEVTVLDDGVVVLISDFPPGQSLRSWLGDQARMEEREVVSLASCLLDGLSKVHDRGLVHGDIKPAAIYFRPGEGVGAFLDGGITPGMWAAKHLGTRTMLIGTPYYAPLEQFTGDSPDELSDLYNLATVLYELLTGVLPWSGKGYVEVFQSKMQKTAPKMSVRSPGVDIHPDLETVIGLGLRAVRKERHASARAFLAQLQQVDLRS